MANTCFNTLTITGPLTKLNSFHDELKALTDVDTWWTCVNNVADHQGIERLAEPDPRPMGTRLTYTFSGATAQLGMSYETRWWYDEEFTHSLSVVFSDCIIDFFAEEFGMAGAVKMSWVCGDLTEARESVDTLTSGEDMWSDAIHWGDGVWTVDDIPTSNLAAFKLFVNSEDEYVRLFAAEHDKIPLGQLARLLSDRSAEVRDTALGNPRTTISVIEKAVRKKFGMDASTDLSNLPVEVLTAYLLDEDRTD